MGMFDYVRSEIPMPDGFTGDLQTKDFDCIMTTILIRADGRLVKEEKSLLRVTSTEESASVPPDTRSPTAAVRSIHIGWRDMDYHGDFEFYGTNTSPDDAGSVFHHFIARYTHGNLEYIKTKYDRSGELFENPPPDISD